VLRAQLAAAFRTRTRDEWAATFAVSDACVSPVLDMGEAQQHAQLRERGGFVSVDGHAEPAPAPRLSRTPGQAGTSAPRPGDDTRTVLEQWLDDSDAVAELLRDGVAVQRQQEAGTHVAAMTTTERSA